MYRWGRCDAQLAAETHSGDTQAQSEPQDTSAEQTLLPAAGTALCSGSAGK